MDVSITIQSQVPAGTSLNFRGESIPYGYLAEDGSLVSRVTYARLFEQIGTTYGAGDGSTTFKLPDSRSRVDVGSGLGAGLTNKVLGAVGGEETHVLSESEMPSHTHIQNAHNHGITDTGHTHTTKTEGNVGGSTVDVQISTHADYSTGTIPTSNSTTGITINNSTAVNQNTGGGAAHNNMQPFLVATKMIKY